ncbi:transmembrane protein [Cystoisospora suis]|uniref:Transmembrane protein n=1 Tax=Cystoisospora suis TaxID=483139 RepID=A0A2C6KLS9_9APIC|nr:transmembrane protein [Cystoisospora suis]
MSSWLSAKINALGERVMDSVLDAVVQNQDVHLKNLQNMQQWNISRLVNRVVNAKYFYKQSNVEACPDFSGLFPSPPLSSPYGCLQTDSSSSSPVSRPPSSATPSLLVPRSPVGRLDVKINSCALVFFVAEGSKVLPHVAYLQRQQQNQHLVWQAVVHLENQEQRSPCIKMEKKKDAYAMNEILFNSEFQFDVRDLWADLCLDVCALKTKKHIIIHASNNSSAASGMAPSGGRGLRPQGATVADVGGEGDAPRSAGVTRGAGGERGKKKPRDAPQNLTGGGSSDQHDFRGDDTKPGHLSTPQLHVPPESLGQNPASPRLTSADGAGAPLSPRMAPPFSRGNDRYLYGRAIVPLASFLAACPPRWEAREGGESCAGGENGGDGTRKTQIPGKKKSEADGIENSGQPQVIRVSRRDFWVQLFPDNNRLAERKYLKPVRGFEEFGMRNPQSTLGFLHVSLSFEWIHRPIFSPLLSCLLPPAQSWVVPLRPEPHYIEAFAQRCKDVMEEPPRWTHLFFHSGGHLGDRTWLGSLCWLSLWLNLFYLICIAPLYQFPLCFGIAVVTVSFSYSLLRAKRFFRLACPPTSTVPVAAPPLSLPSLARVPCDRFPSSSVCSSSTSSSVPAPSSGAGVPLSSSALSTLSFPFFSLTPSQQSPSLRGVPEPASPAKTAETEHSRSDSCLGRADSFSLLRYRTQPLSLTTSYMSFDGEGEGQTRLSSSPFESLRVSKHENGTGAFLPAPLGESPEQQELDQSPYGWSGSDDAMEESPVTGGSGGIMNWGRGKEDDKDMLLRLHDEGEKRERRGDLDHPWSRTTEGSIGGSKGSDEFEEGGPLSSAAFKKRGGIAKKTSVASSTGGEAAWLKIGALTGFGGSAFAPLKGDEGSGGGREEKDSGGQDVGIEGGGEERDGGREVAWSDTGDGGSTKTGKHGRKGKKTLLSSGIGRVSKIRSPFGEIHLYVRESERGEQGIGDDGDEIWPVFADDEAEPLVQDQLNKLLELATGLQTVTGYLSSGLEKLRYAFNWEDPLLSSASVFLLLFHSLLWTFLLFVFSLVPLLVWRALLFAGLLILGFLTDPRLHAKVDRKLAQKKQQQTRGGELISGAKDERYQDSGIPSVSESRHRSIASSVASLDQGAGEERKSVIENEEGPSASRKSSKSNVSRWFLGSSENSARTHTKAAPPEKSGKEEITDYEGSRGLQQHPKEQPSSWMHVWGSFHPAVANSGSSSHGSEGGVPSKLCASASPTSFSSSSPPPGCNQASNGSASDGAASLKVIKPSSPWAVLDLSGLLGRSRGSSGARAVALSSSASSSSTTSNALSQAQILEVSRSERSHEGRSASAPADALSESGSHTAGYFGTKGSVPVRSDDLCSRDDDEKKPYFWSNVVQKISALLQGFGLYLVRLLVLRISGLCFFLFSGLKSVAQALHVRVFTPCLSLAEAVVTTYFALIHFWWLRLPDRREIEHRLIASTQVISSLDALVPLEGWSPASQAQVVAPVASVSPEDRYGGERPCPMERRTGDDGSGETKAGVTGTKVPVSQQGVSLAWGGYSGTKNHDSVGTSSGVSARVRAYLEKYFEERWERENPLAAAAYAAAPYLLPGSQVTPGSSNKPAADGTGGGSSSGPRGTRGRFFEEKSGSWKLGKHSSATAQDVDAVAARAASGGYAPETAAYVASLSPEELQRWQREQACLGLSPPHDGHKGRSKSPGGTPEERFLKDKVRSRSQSGGSHRHHRHHHHHDSRSSSRRGEGERRGKGSFEETLKTARGVVLGWGEDVAIVQRPSSRRRARRGEEKQQVSESPAQKRSAGSAGSGGGMGALTFPDFPGLELLFGKRKKEGEKAECRQEDHRDEDLRRRGVGENQ